MKITFSGKPRLPLRQHGMATILIIMLMGMALTVTALGVMYSVRTSQEQQITVHAATHSQAGVWAAAQAVRLYLEELDEADLEALKTAAPLTFTLINNDVTATFTSDENQGAGPSSALQAPEDNSNQPYHLRTIIRYTDTEAKSTSTLEVVYNIIPAGNIANNTSGSGGGPEIYINKGLNLSGDAEFIVDKNTKLNVIGVLNFGKSTIKEIHTIRATSDITLNKEITANTLHSNGFIAISGVEEIKVLDSATAVSYMTITGPHTIHSASAGTAMTITGSTVDTASAGAAMTITRGTVKTANAAGAMTITSSTVDTANAGGAMTITDSTVDSNANAGAAMTITNGTVGNDANAGAAITITDGTVKNNANAGAAMSITGSTVGNNANAGVAMTITGSTVKNSANAVGAMTISGAKTQVGTANSGGALTIDAASTVNQSQGLKPNMSELIPKIELAPVPTPDITPVFAITITPPKIDAYQLKDAANYAFRYVDGKIQVDVKRVSSINDSDVLATYHLVGGDTLCSTLSAQGECSSKEHKICVNKACITYGDKKGEQWKLSEKKGNTVLAPGVLWFEGDLKLDSGTYRNSIIATKNIVTTSNTVVYAANTTDAKTCQGTVFYPSNLCNTTGLTSNPIGNIALLAGSYKGNAFSGGTITLGSNQEIYGSVIAGDTLILEGTAAINGYITTAGQGTGAPQSWKGNVKIDVRIPPGSAYTGETPDMSGDSTAAPGTDGTGTPGEVQLLWSRYL